MRAGRRQPDPLRARLLRPAPRAAAELEIEHHLAELADRLKAEGMDPEAVAFCASLAPALRATPVDRLVALRAE